MTIYEKAIHHYGEVHQLIKAIEELNELAVELSKYLNGNVEKVSDIANEIADVKITLEQVEIICKCKVLVNHNIGKKLDRLQNRITEAKWK